MKDVRWLAEYSEDGQVAFRIGRAGDVLVAEWIDTLRLVARRDGTVLELADAPGADPRDTGKIRRGSARLLLRQLGGKLALHGAAVGFGDRAVVFLGRSGHGKSTLAAAMCARRDAVLFADDAIAIDESPNGYSITASEVDHWLDGPSRVALGLANDGAGKLPVRCDRPASHDARLVMFVDLAFDDGASVPRLGPLHGLEAVACLVPQVVRFVLDEPELHRRELESLMNLVDRVPVLRLERPRRLDLLDAALDLVLDHPLLEHVS